MQAYYEYSNNPIKVRCNRIPKKSKKLSNDPIKVRCNVMNELNAESLSNNPIKVRCNVIDDNHLKKG